MASELRVNTLKDASGNNSIGLSYVAEGSAKAWVRFNGDSVTSDSDLAGVGDSFNTSTVVDGGTGRYKTTFTNSFNNTNFSFTWVAGNASDNGIRCLLRMYDAPTTSSFGDQSVGVSTNGTNQDAEQVAANFHGDLA